MWLLYEVSDMDECKHVFVYDEIHKEIVCVLCGYVLSSDDKQRIHKKAFERMEAEDGAD